MHEDNVICASVFMLSLLFHIMSVLKATGVLLWVWSPKLDLSLGRDFIARQRAKKTLVLVTFIELQL